MAVLRGVTATVDGMSELDAVTFDFWETLCTDPRQDLMARRVQAMADALATHGVRADHAELRAAHVVAWERWNHQWEANVHVDWRFVADATLESVPHLAPAASAPYAAARQAFHDATLEPDLVLLDGVVEVLEELGRRRVRVGIICDVGIIPSVTLRAELGRLGVIGAFDHWSFSDEVGVYKPDARIFEHALVGLGDIDPERAAHVGDRRRTDVAGARAMGMRSVRIRDCFDDPSDGPEADAVITSHAELLTALGLT